MKNKKILIIGGIVLVVVLLGLGLYIYSSGYYHAIRGAMSEEADQALLFFKEAYRRNPNAYMVAHDIACNYSAMNEKQEAIKWLKLTLKTSYADAARKWAKSNGFDNIRDNPDFRPGSKAGNTFVELLK